MNHSDNSDHSDNFPRFWAVIPCAGTGSRAGAGKPKQYQDVAGKPMVLHTLAAFAAVSRLSGTLLVLSPDDHFFENTEIASISIAHCGGSTRAASVFNGISTWLQRGAAATDWVLVHDAARCLITPAQIEKLMLACENDAAGIGGLLALPLPDTLKREENGRVAQTIHRSDKWLAQTPQMFRLGALRDALTLAGDQVTDESSAMEIAGFSPLLVEGSAQNFKVTYPQDFALAQAVLHSRG